ncbi:RNA polymerase sigma-70 factor [Nonomuraea jiangxiensis]|uniref:RNA polymerase sigma-70 factor, ECF subfamily n=1 Tax=Nonomuraea jiangxiensis TaxID=633440 RepID=A0A1G9NK57_9ACTN|nr:RNA polymerase sigma-70 factor [Nonomuraea jiangxiensis]SDL86982.1 RNA polymerase sigma-70 factor, ECF subfamily [Nonomuraea jiangxiensis]
MMPAVDFEEHRPMLLGLAYRLLGSMWDAEDVVQEAWLRWQGTDQSQVREPRAFLTTVVSRLALDQLRSARVKREAYTGPWLPEPVMTSEAGPLDTAELRDTVSFATLHLMERLSPPERAVFVLREAFELPYDEIAGIVGASVPNARQMYRRASLRLAEGRDRFRPSTQEHAELLVKFMEAAGGGDLTALTDLLHEDVVLWNDGGGRTRAALRPIAGRQKVASFLLGLTSRYQFSESRLVEVNGGIALLTSLEEGHQLVMLDIVDGRIKGLYGVLNPDKLTRVPVD